MKKLKNVKLLIFLMLCSFIFSGCALYNSQSFWEVSWTRVDLESKNFKVRKLGAQGNASCPYLFGLPLGESGMLGIPLGHQDLQAQVMKELHKNWDGKGSCFLHNINTEWTNYGFPGIFIWHQNTITADIYEFDSEYIGYAIRKN
jgi:hypothetical protein